MGLDLTEFRLKNVSRVGKWHPNTSIMWSGADWSNAMCGEAGEAANIVKKLRRIETNMVAFNQGDWNELISSLADEIADTFTYLDLLAHHYHIALSPAIVKKFNQVSKREGFPERLTCTRERSVL